MRGCAVPTAACEGPVAICCGKGNNAGDGLVIARHLDLRGIDCAVCSSGLTRRPCRGTPASITPSRGRAGLGIDVCEGPDAAAQLDRHLDGVEWIVDALLGTGAVGEPRPPLDSVIDRLNAQPRP